MAFNTSRIIVARLRGGPQKSLHPHLDAIFIQHRRRKPTFKGLLWDHRLEAPVTNFMLETKFYDYLISPLGPFGGQCWTNGLKPGPTIFDKNRAGPNGLKVGIGVILKIYGYSNVEPK